MKKLIEWFNRWWLAAASIFLLIFIPLYPKLPLLDIKNTWVYVRVEDFIVLFVLLGWVIHFFRSRLTIKTPLTLPILAFWIIGGLATLHSILLIAPIVWEIFPNVALLSFIRRIEYMSLFFVSFSAAKDKRYLTYVSIALVFTVLCVSLYGLGQKYIGLPAYLTMNEEFAKGVPIQLSALSRVSSTFGGHYDLAAYLVLTLPIVVSLIFGVRSPFLKILLGSISLLGAVVLFMTVSRISVFALVVSLMLVVFIHRRKLVLLLIPVAIVGGILFISFAPRLLDRFVSTVKQVDVLVDARSGTPIGHIKEVPSSYFEGITVRQQFYDNIGDVTAHASPSARFVIPFSQLPEQVVLLTEPTAPTGEDLPSGTGYINLALSPNIKRIGNFLYEPKQRDPNALREAHIINGEYLIKRAYAYDLSFTTRFQGEWPKALAAFKRNIFFGSGYGSVSLAVDNSYLRMLGEVGALGFIAFFSIFLMVLIYVKKIWPDVDSLTAKSFVVGYLAGVLGLMINALFIDVFEASKVAFSLWLLTGAIMGGLMMYKRIHLHFLTELKRVLTSPYAIVCYLVITVLLLWAPLVRNYFTGDDFTWFRWVASCGGEATKPTRCAPSFTTIGQFFTQAEGFFYRPGTKIYFSISYWLFWLNQNAYHAMSLTLHIVVSVLVFILAGKLFKRKSLATLAAFLFVVMTGFSEAIFWISASGFLFAAVGMLSSLLLYAAWREKKRVGFAIAAIISCFFALSFHEMAVVTPLFYLLYEWTMSEEPRSIRGMLSNTLYRWLFLPVPVYAAIRYLAQSHWLSGDYNFSIIKFPLNAVGNSIGYVLMTLAGPLGSPVYQGLRGVLREHALLAAAAGIVVAGIGIWVYRAVMRNLDTKDRNVVHFSLLFAFIALLPFLGLGNITSRYLYLASIGFLFFFIFLISKLYDFLLVSSREIALAVIAVILSVFVVFHSVAIHQLHQDWFEAGGMVQNFLITMDYRYQDYWSTSEMEFHFVNVPIRHREAWVFPVGLKDALWFSFQNPNIRVFMWPDTESALNAVTYGSATQKVFVFDEDGTVHQIQKQPAIQ